MEKGISSKKVLMVWGGWLGHEPEQCCDFVAKILKNEGFEVIVKNSLDAFLDVELMKSLCLVIPIWTMGQITGEQEKALLDAVKGGLAIAGWHGGMCDSFRNNTEYQFMTGGQWVTHPGNVIQYTVQITDHNDSITKGIEDFSITSEQYYMHTDPSNKVLATTTFSGEHGVEDWIQGVTMPVVWKKIYGKGRVFYSSLGHVLKDFEVPQVAEIIKRGALWASGNGELGL